jgi:hypothetical protein
VDAATLEELRAALPGDVVISDPDAVEKYRHDWSRDPLAGILPSDLVLPFSTPTP